MKNLINYSVLKEKYNQQVSAELQMKPTTLTGNDDVFVIDGPISVILTSTDQQIEKITIISTILQTDLYDQVFMAFEAALNCSSINFFNAYQRAIKNHSLEIGQAHGIQAIHDARNGKLIVSLQKEA